MYLKGSKWSMNRRRRPVNWFRVVFLGLLALALFYVNQVVVPEIPPIGQPTVTPTRSAESYVTEAEAYFQDGKLLQAIEAYEQAIRSNPTDATLYIALARVQVFAGQYSEAHKNADYAILRQPDNSMAHALRAWALDYEGDYLNAEASVKRALELDPNNGVAHAYYAEILVDSYLAGTGPLNSIERAAEASRTALALAPNTIEAHQARGYVLEVTANYEEAIREYQAAISINGNIPSLYLALGRNYRALGIYDQAVDAFTRADALNPADPTPNLLTARTYATIGEYAKAVQYAEQAVKDSPADPRLRGALGVMYYKNAQFPEAVRELSLAVNGGTTEDGQKITGLTLVSNDLRLAEYYYTYGLALARTLRCGEALPVAQLIQATIPGDEIAMANAQEIIKVCEQNLNVTPSPTVEVLPTETATVTPTP